MPHRSRVLAVDDEAHNRMLVCDLLEPEGFEVVTAESAEVALVEIERRAPDLIISDVSMGGMSGVEMCRILKSREDTRYIPFITVTGMSSKDDRVAGIEAGADDYLIKPIEPEELLARVRTTVRLGAYQRILAEREKLRVAAASMSDGLVVMTAEWIPLYMNESARRLLHLDGSKCDLLAGLATRFRLSEEPAALRGVPARECRFEMRRLASQGPPLILAASLARVDGAGAGPPELVLSVRDVTADRIESHVKFDFVSFASHKLRTPLTVVLGNLELLRDGTLGQTTPEQADSLEATWRGAVELRGVSESLIRFASLARESLHLMGSSLSFGDVVEVVRDHASTLAAATGKSFDLEAVSECDSWDALVDPWAMSGMISAIVNNSFKFSIRDGVTLRVTSRRSEDGLARLEIADDGPGFPSDKVMDVLKPFCQLEDYFTGNVEGLGLGLPMVCRLATLSGGRVLVDSEVGAGTVVTLAFPSPPKPNNVTPSPCGT